MEIKAYPFLFFILVRKITLIVEASKPMKSKTIKGEKSLLETASFQIPRIVIKPNKPKNFLERNILGKERARRNTCLWAKQFRQSVRKIMIEI